MDAEVDQCASDAEDARRLREGRLRVIKVGVRQNGNDGVELPVLEGECVSVRVDERSKMAGAPLGGFELIDRDVCSHH